MSRRVGWLGGSFDPVHEGHIAAARAAADALGLAEVLLVPARQPPQKLERVLAPGPDRMALLALACAPDPRLQPCDVELVRPGPSFSLDTARDLLAGLPPGTALLAIIGADTLADLGTWRGITELAALVAFCPVTRPGHALSVEHLAPHLDRASREAIRARCIAMAPHPASSTAVREALRAGRDPAHVAPAVLAEIRRRGLYSSQAGGGASVEGTRLRRP